MARSIPEWLPKSDDAEIPDKVRRRVLNRQRNVDGIPICPDCSMPIRPGAGVDYDHHLPLIDGGAHTESNLRALHRKCHRLKTAREAHERAKERSQAMSVYGIKAKKGWAKPKYEPRPARDIWADTPVEAIPERAKQ